jgi:DNA-binding NarL/FixJ family response regulator
MLPAIRQHARIAFGRCKPDAREEAVQAVVCNACAAIARLAELEKLDLAYASVLARYGVAQVKDGRMTGGHLNCKDVLSGYCQRLKHLTIERLDHYDKTEDCWQEILVADQNATPADLAASRIDFPAWLDTLTARDRKVATKLAAGEKTSAVAKTFNISAGRISQLRRELEVAWRRFHGEDGMTMAPATA